MPSESVFICHASEDKSDFVRPLVDLLIKRGVPVWYDEYTLRPGDSLRESIDRGLATCRLAVVVLSQHFFAKAWTNWELNGIVQRHLDSRGSLIVPIWLNLSSAEVKGYSPPLANIVSIRTTAGLEGVCQAIIDVLGERVPPPPPGMMQMLRGIPLLLGIPLELPVRVTVRVLDGDVLSLVGNWPEPVSAQSDIPLQGSLSGHALVGGRIVTVADLERDFSDSFISFAATRSMLALPLFSENDERYGVLSIGATVPNAFDGIPPYRYEALISLMSPLFRGLRRRSSRGSAGAELG